MQLNIDSTDNEWQWIALTGEGRSLGGKISWGMGLSLGNIFGFYKTRHILLFDTAVGLEPGAEDRGNTNALVFFSDTVQAVNI